MEQKKQNYEDVFLVTDSETGSLPRFEWNFEAKDRKEIIKEDLFPENKGYLLRNFFSESECDYCIRESEKIGINPLAYNKRYRNNDRLLLLSDSISDMVFERLLPFLDEIEVTQEDRKNVGKGLFLEGSWKPNSMNNQWRVCRYNNNGRQYSPKFTLFNRRCSCRSVLHFDRFRSSL